MKDKILLLDDDESYITYMSILFSKRTDLEIVGETDPHKAIQRIANGEDFVLALIDIRMPTLTGIEVAHLLAPHNHPPIIFLTGLGIDELDTYTIAESGATSVITKPKGGDDITKFLNKIAMIVKCYKNSKKRLDECSYFLEESQRAAFIGSYKYDIKLDTWESSSIMDSIFGIGNLKSKTYQNWIDLIHPDDRVAMDQYFRTDVLQHKQSFDRTYRIVRKTDGAVRWVHGLGAIKYNNGEALTMVGTIQDITDNKMTKDASIKNLQKFKDLITTTKTAYLIMSPDGKIKEVSDTFMKMIGCKDYNRINNADVFSLLSSEYVEKMRRSLNLLEKGIPIEDLEICIDSNLCENRGTWIRVNGNIMENGERNVLCLIKNITSKKVEEFSKYISNQKQKDRVRQNISRIRSKIQNMDT